MAGRVLPVDASLLQACQLTWSADGQITGAEGDCARVLGKSPEQLIGTSLQQLFELTPARVRVLDGKARGPGGVEFVPMRLGHTEHTLLRLSLGTVNGEAAAAIIDAHAFLNGAPPLQISKLASSLSHEIRNPLSSVKMAVQTLARNPGHSERDQRRLTIANREIRTMERMLGLLSEYGREVSPHQDQLPLRGLLQDALSLIEPELSERGIQIDYDEPDELPRVKVDPHRLRLVLAQLLLNVAMGYTEGGTLKLSLRPGPNGGASLTLIDEAASVLPDERATLFEPFGSRLARGAGLSLAALRRVLQSQGGDVSAEPMGEQGAVFTLTFPGA